MTHHHDDPARRSAMVQALGVLGSGPEERFDRITRMAAEAFDVPLTFLNLVHDGVVTSQSAQGWRQGGSAPADAVFCSTTVLQAEPLVVPDTLLDDRFRSLPPVTDDPGVRFYAGAPLTMVDGTRVGTLCIMDAQPRELSADDLRLLEDLARWAERELGQVIDAERVRRVLDGVVPDPVDVPGYDLDVVTVQRDEGGGAIVDWRVGDDGALFLAVGEVVAAGRAAALLAADVRGALVARMGRPGPDTITELDRQIAPDLGDTGAAVTLVAVRVDPATGRGEFADAGHGLTLHVRRDGTVDVLRSTDLPVGLQPGETPRSTGSFVLEPGDRLVLCTEGVLALPGLGDLDALGALAVDCGDGAELVARVRALLPTGAPAVDATLLALTRA